jgi:hypothetical protein
VAAVFAVLSRVGEAEERDADNVKKVRVYAGEDVEGVAPGDAAKMKAKNPDEGLSGVSPRFVINALSNAIIQSQAKSLTTMDVLIALKDAIESDVRIDGKKKRKWVDFLVAVRKDFYNRWVKEDVHKALFVSFEQEAQQLLDKYIDEVEATLDNRTLRDPITSSARKWCARRWAPTSAARSSPSTPTRRCTTRSSSTCSRAGATCCASFLRPPGRTTRRGRRSRWWRSGWSTSTATTRTAPARP